MHFRRLMPSQETSRIRPGSVSVPDSYDHNGQQATGIGPDRICRIRFPLPDSSPDWMLFFLFFFFSLSLFFLLFSCCFFPSLSLFLFLHRKWPGWSVLDPNRIRFWPASGPVPISMRYPASARNELSQIWPASGKTGIGTTSGNSIIPGRMVIARSKSDPFLFIWPGSDIDALSRIRLDWTKPDSTRLWQNWHWDQSGLHPVLLYSAGWSPDLNQIRFCTSGLVPV